MHGKRQTNFDYLSTEDRLKGNDSAEKWVGVGDCGEILPDDCR